MAKLYERSRSTIAEHILNILSENELCENEVCRKFRHTANDKKYMIY